MDKTFIAQATISIDAPLPKVWDALTKPDLIKQYLFGTQVLTDWQVGSPITYMGVWDGKTYEDKGIVLQVEPGKLLVSTFWSALSGLPDLLENYKTVRYELSHEGSGTRLTIAQADNDSQLEADDHSEQSWATILAGIKRLVED